MRALLSLVLWISLLELPVRAQELMVITESLGGFQRVENGTLVGGKTGQPMLDAMKALHLNQEIRVLPWGRAYALAKTRPNVLIFSLVRTAQREKAFIWVTRLLSISTIAFALDTAPQMKVKQLSDLKSRVIAVKRNDVIHERLLELGFQNGVNLAPVLTNTDAISMVLSGRADVHPTARYHLSIECQALGCELRQFTPLMAIPELKQDFYLAASLGTEPKWIEAFRRTLEGIVGQPSYYP